MTRFLFASTPEAAHSTVPLPVAARLVQRGHDVVWYAGSAYRTSIERTGARFAPIVDAVDYSGRSPVDAFPELGPLSGPKMIKAMFRLVFLGQVPAQVRDLSRILATYPADVIVADPNFMAAGLVEELGGPPYVDLNISMLGLASRDTPPFGPGLLPMAGPLGRVRDRAGYTLARSVMFAPTNRQYGEIRRDLRLPPDPRHVMDTVGSRHLLVQPTVPSFEYPRSDLPAGVRFVGPLVPDRGPDWEPPPWWDELSNGRPVVHVTQGTFRDDPADLILSTLFALAGEPLTVVATTGGPGPLDLAHRAGRPLPDNARVWPFIPYDPLLARASVFVTNGGYTGVNLALRHGVPIVQAGITEEKKEIGARIRWSGVGVALGSNAPGEEALHKAVQQVLGDRRFRAAAGRIQADMAGHDGVTEATDLIEGFALARARARVGA